MTVIPYKGVQVFNEDGTFRKEDDVVQGRSFSSNLTKMVKHMDKLEAIQQGKPPSPVIISASTSLTLLVASNGLRCVTRTRKE